MSLKSSMKPVSLREICEVVDSLGNLAESTLDPHSLALVISKSGEAIFTHSVWKLLSEAGFSSPIAKVIINCVKNYTSSSGEDSKYILFILKEIISAIHSKIDGNGGSFMRAKFIHEFISLKQILPCIFHSIYNMPDIHVTQSNSSSFSRDLHFVVKAFMEQRFSVNVAKHLGSLICDFILGIKSNKSSLKFILDYITAHFDIFCSKALVPLAESQVIKGFVFCRKSIPPIVTLENTKFVVIWDMSVKSLENDVFWEISSESFVYKLNYSLVYKNIFAYFKEQNIKLLLTPCASDKYIKLMCDENNILLLDWLDREEIENILSCVHLSPLENLNESLELKHIGELQHLNLLSYNNSYFLNLLCSNFPRFLNAHHILLCAAFDALWKDYYSECLNCLKIVQQWLSPNSSICSSQPSSVNKGGKNISSQYYINRIDSNLIIDGCENSSQGPTNLVCSGSVIEGIVNSSCKQHTDIICTSDSVVKPEFLNSTAQLHLDNVSALPSQLCDDATKINRNQQSSNNKQNCDICFQFKTSFENSLHKTAYSDAVELKQNVGFALSPGLWELSFMTSLKKVSTNLNLPCKSVMQVLHFIFVKIVCKRIGVPFKKLKDLENAYASYHVICNSDKTLLEPIACKEIMIYSVLDLVVQLLKIDGIVATK